MNAAGRGCEGLAETLSSWVDGELDALRARDMAAHVASCAPCAARAGLWRGWTSAARPGASRTPAKVERLLELARAGIGTAATAPRSRIVAFGSGWRAAAALLLTACLLGTVLASGVRGRSRPGGVRLRVWGEGSVQIVSAQGEVRDVRGDRAVEGNARIAVGALAQAVLVFPEGAQVHLRPGSEVALSSLGVRQVLYVASGTVFVDHPTYGRAPFEIRTRAGEFLPRGTRYLVRVDPATGRGELGVLEGSVRLDGGRVLAVPGGSVGAGMLAEFEP